MWCHLHLFSMERLMPFNSNDLERLKMNDSSMTSISFESHQIGNDITNEDFKKLVSAAKGNPYFESLNLSESYLSAEGASLIVKYLALKRLCLRNCFVVRTAFLQLSASQTLKEMDVGKANIDDDAIREIARIRNLIYLSAEHNGVSDIGACILAKHPQLLYINLAHNQIKNEGAKALLANKNLISLELRYNPLIPKIKEQVAKHCQSSYFPYIGDIPEAKAINAFKR
jgi:Ran GTPase-activating protein (RanGAP) involved in mRNA processing and transport